MATVKLYYIYYNFKNKVLIIEMSKHDGHSVTITGTRDFYLEFIFILLK